MRQLSTTSTVAFPNVKSNFFFNLVTSFTVFENVSKESHIGQYLALYSKRRILLRVLHISYHGHIVYCIEVIVTIVLSVFAVHIVFFLC